MVGHQETSKVSQHVSASYGIYCFTIRPASTPVNTPLPRSVLLQTVQTRTPFQQIHHLPRDRLKASHHVSDRMTGLLIQQVNLFNQGTIIICDKIPFMYLIMVKFTISQEVALNSYMLLMLVSSKF